MKSLGIFRVGGEMPKKAIGFYWTLPVPWVGFTELSEDLDEAAEQSQTIRYQREMVRRYVRDRGYELIREEAFLEIEPDRVSEWMRGALEKLSETAKHEDAVVLAVDFAEVHGQRRNVHLGELTRDSHIPLEIIPPDPVRFDNWYFDPSKHFADWRERQSEWKAGRDERKKTALQRAKELSAKDLSLAVVAKMMNEEKVSSATGKPWTKDNLRKLLKSEPDAA